MQRLKPEAQVQVQVQSCMHRLTHALALLQEEFARTQGSTAARPAPPAQEPLAGPASRTASLETPGARPCIVAFAGDAGHSPLQHHARHLGA